MPNEDLERLGREAYEHAQASLRPSRPGWLDPAIAKLTQLEVRPEPLFRPPYANTRPGPKNLVGHVWILGHALSVRPNWRIAFNENGVISGVVVLARRRNVSILLFPGLRVNSEISPFDKFPASRYWILPSIRELIYETTSSDVWTKHVAAVLHAIEYGKAREWAGSYWLV